MIVEITTKESVEGDSNRLRISNEGMGDNGHAFLVSPVQDKTGKEVGKSEMIVDIAELKSALVMFPSHAGDHNQELRYAMQRVSEYLDGRMEEEPSRQIADAANLLSNLLERGEL